MAYWLFKSEPGAWSWDDQVAAGKKGDDWDGVRNHQAANNMKAMKVGDLGFFYHSVNEKRVVGIVEVCKEYHADPTDASGRFGMVCVRAIEPMPEPVTLADIKAEGLPCRIVHHENLGSEAYFHAELNIGGRVISRMDSTALDTFTTGHEATVVIDPKNALLFDKEGQRLTSKIEVAA